MDGGASGAGHRGACFATDLLGWSAATCLCGANGCDGPGGEEGGVTVWASGGRARRFGPGGGGGHWAGVDRPNGLAGTSARVCISDDSLGLKYWEPERSGWYQRGKESQTAVLREVAPCGWDLVGTRFAAEHSGDCSDTCRHPVKVVGGCVR